MSHWSHFKRCLHRVFHPNAHLLAAIRLGRMQVNQEARVQLPPIFDAKPLFIPIRADSLLSPDLTLWAVEMSPEENCGPEVLYFTPEVYHQRLQERLQLAQHSAGMIRKTILLSARDEPPAEGETLHETPAWLQ